MEIAATTIALDDIVVIVESESPSQAEDQGMEDEPFIAQEL